MRSLTFVVAIVVSSGIADAQETLHRLTADVFVEAGFPTEIVEAAQKADEVAKRTEESRVRAKQYVERIEPVFDRAIFMLQIPLRLFEELQSEYEAALQRYWGIDRELKLADDLVSALYYNWALECSDAKSAQVFQEWQTATRVDYVKLSKEEEEAYSFLLGIDRSRIFTGHHRTYRPAPPKMWRINDNR
ncbi:MAG: hypothetical protein Q7S43_04250 [bacterium]|nr:hypothetical protein [bacterium]